MQDLTGMRFTRLVVIEFSHKKEKQYLWRCKCDCGTEKIVSGHALLQGSTKSCKCLLRESVAARSRTHGKDATPIYYSFYAMLKRCYNPKYEQFEHYGGRGIKVCDRWRNSFENFLADMGPTWAKGLTLDRVDTNGNYEPNNCKWSTAKEQARNRRNTVIIDTPEGKMHIGDAVVKYGLTFSTLSHRIERGWSPDLLFSPIGTKRPGIGRWANRRN